MFAIWAVIIGALLITIALSNSLLKRLPLSTAMLYLVAGMGLGPLGFALMDPQPRTHALVLEHLTEVAVLVSLFAAGLKLSVPLRHSHWRLPLRLAFVSMTLTVAMIALVGWLGLGLSPGAAILLGGILAPTDPVLASDVQVEGSSDRDRLRFSLTGEGGFNDGAAFPFVMLGLGIAGLARIGDRRLALVGSGCDLGDQLRAGGGRGSGYLDRQAGDLSAQPPTGEFRAG